MTTFLYFAATPAGPQALPVRAGAAAFADLYAGIDLGVYSVLRTFDHHQFLDLDEHLARSRRAIDRLGWPGTFDETLLRANLDAVCRAHSWPEAQVRYDILPAPAFENGSRLLLALRALPLIPSIYYENGVQVDFAPDLRRTDPIVKDAAFSQVRRKYDVSGAVHEYLLLDADGFILEGLSSNFYGVRAGVLHTAGAGALAGVTRKLLVTLADELAIPVNMTPIHQSEIHELDEAALSSSSRALLPIVKVAGQAIGAGRPGPICQALLAAYNARIPQLIRPAV